MRDHDAQKTQELVYESDVKAGLRIWWRNLTGYLPISKSSCSRGIEEEASMCIESHRSRGIDLNLCCRGAIRHDYCPRAILSPQARISPQESLALCFLFRLLSPPYPTSISPGYDGDEQSQCSCKPCYF